MSFLCPEEIERYAEEHTSPLDPLLEELVEYTQKNTPLPQMLTGRVEGTFLRMLVELSGARRVLEIGTFTGFSALMMAKGLPEDGELITIEVNEEYARIAKEFFGRAEWGKRIRLIVGDAREKLKDFPAESFDFIFVDADKSSYPYYYERGMELLRRGGLLVFDNALWKGEVLNPRDARSRAIDEVNKKALADPRTEIVLLTVRDGMLLVRKVR